MKIECTPKETADLIAELRERLPDNSVDVLHVQMLREMIDEFGLENTCLTETLKKKEKELGLWL